MALVDETADATLHHWHANAVPSLLAGPTYTNRIQIARYTSAINVEVQPSAPCLAQRQMKRQSVGVSTRRKHFLLPAQTNSGRNNKLGGRRRRPARPEGPRRRAKRVFDVALQDVRISYTVSKLLTLTGGNAQSVTGRQYS